MAPSMWSATDPNHLALMGQTDAELRLQGLQPGEIAALRAVQQAAPPNTQYITADAVRNELMFGGFPRAGIAAPTEAQPVADDVTWTPIVVDPASPVPISDVGAPWPVSPDEEPPADTDSATRSAGTPPTARRTTRNK